MDRAVILNPTDDQREKIREAARKGSLLRDFREPTAKLHHDEEEENLFFSLIQKFEEEERSKEANQEEIAYKMIEEHMQKISYDLSDWTKCLKPPKEARQGGSMSDEGNDLEEMVIQPDKLRKLFRVDLCNPSICPYIPFIIGPAKPMPYENRETGKLPKSKLLLSKMSEKQKAHMQPRYYTDPSHWFPKREKTVDEVLTDEEEVFVNSFSFKTFMRFLDSKQQEPPKIFEKLREKQKMQTKKAKEEEHRFLAEATERREQLLKRMRRGK